jgi:hypothetical protein
MEVHNHTHTERKNWTHYLWEFLMLFLAVFCGFLAENQREHMVEHQRAKVYAVTLYEELKKDTISLDTLIKQDKSVVLKLDSFCLYSAEKTKRNVKNGMLYYYSSFVTWINFFSSNNATVEQLKSSGNLRIMGNEVSQKISEYGKKLSDLENEYELSKSEFTKLEDLYFKIFDVYVRYNIIPDNEGYFNRDSLFSLDTPLINDDPKLMKEFTGRARFAAGIYRMHNRRHNIPLKEFIVELMTLLKKKYHLK